jgi:hypothetical protein
MTRLLAAAGPESGRVAIRAIGDTFVVPRGGCPRGTTAVKDAS